MPTGRVAHSERGFVFIPSNLNLYAMALSSGVMWRAFIGSPIISGPVIDPHGDAWVVAHNGEVHHIETQSKRAKFTLTADSTSRIVAVTSDRVFVLDSTGLTARTRAGEVSWMLQNVEQVTADLRVVQLGSNWVWIDEKGKPKASRELDLHVSAQATHAKGLVYVPASDGRLYVFGPEGTVEWCQVAHAPLLSPHVLGARGAVVVASGDGWLVGIHSRRLAPAP
jgi:hypothetical protein